MTPVRALLGALTLLLAWPGVGALPVYHGLAIDQLRLGVAARRAGCAYCHQAETEALNPFGKAVLAAGRSGAGGVPLSEQAVAGALYAVLRADRDADDDGYADVLEVLAGTLPGDRRSRPNASPAALRAKLKRLGGVDRYRPN